MNRLSPLRHSLASRLSAFRKLSYEPLEDRRMLSVLFVDDDATAGGDGLGWSSAFQDLQHALSQAATLNADGHSGNDVDQIWIAEGVYKPSSELEPGDPRSASFSLVDGVTLYGGFLGTETTLEDRDASAHVTTLSGDLGTVDNDSDNAYTVVYCESGIEASLDDLSVSEGNADGSYGYGPERTGGGIYNGGTLTVTNSTLSRNSTVGDGGGVCNAGTLTLTNSTMSGNSAGGSGGGIYNNRNGTLTVTNSTLSGNSATSWHGGGIYNAGTLTLTNSTLSGNSADNEGGGIYNTYSGLLTVTNSTLSGNSASWGGGIANLF